MHNEESLEKPSLWSNTRALNRCQEISMNSREDSAWYTPGFCSCPSAKGWEGCAAGQNPTPGQGLKQKKQKKPQQNCLRFAYQPLQLLTMTLHLQSPGFLLG